MFKVIELEYLYFNFKGTYFKIPTFGKISKIIDFGRATFNCKTNYFLVMYLKRMVKQKDNIVIPPEIT